ncbi:MAG: SCP2 sterol-binding domain-containing protein [Nitrososphaerota archaeon]|nr:SCP2 sterol-binding domain-containing protein [Candidatus Calditenuaceae archaeon]MDW8073138.1 SCP2 sterol-binding domain-containing protein [Nitrososphaerota archaeon]
MADRSFSALQDLVAKASEKPLIKMRTARMVKTFQFKPTDAQPFYLEIVNGVLKVEQGEATSPVATILATDDDLAGIISGTVDPVQLFFAGRVRVQGSLFDAQELATILRDAAR